MNFARALILVIVSLVTPFFAKACPATTELWQYDHVQVKLNIETTNPVLVRAFESALNFWSMYVQMDWQLAGASDCNLTLSEADLSKMGAYAYTHVENMQARIVFGSDTTNTERLSYIIAIHELGHLFGLRHTKSHLSVLAESTDYFRMKNGAFLTHDELKALAKVHRLRMNL